MILLGVHKVERNTMVAGGKMTGPTIRCESEDERKKRQQREEEEKERE